MAIQHRRGDYNDYRPNKMLSGELAFALQHDPRGVDGRAVHVAFAPGVDKTLMTFDDAEVMIEDATEIAIAGAVEYASEEAEAWAHGNGFTKNDYFSGDGTTTSFTLSNTPAAMISVDVDGAASTLYSLSGNVLTFTTAPPAGNNNIRIEYTVNTTNDNSKYYKDQSSASASQAASSASSASGSATTATNQATLARSYAKGDTNTRTGETTDNAEYYKTQAGNSATSASASASQAAGYASSASASASQATNAATTAEGYKDSAAASVVSAQNAQAAAENARDRAEAAADTAVAASGVNLYSIAASPDTNGLALYYIEGDE